MASDTTGTTEAMESLGIEPSHYVAIGASAGGLEALQLFMQHTPADSGLAFIVIQHLSPDFKSLMDELLGKHTKMPILNVTDGVKVTANTVYLIPPNKNMMIAEGKLILSDRMLDSGNNFPIDTFFRSLAEDQQHRSVAVVLSGTGSDGSRGVPAVKEVGGVIIVQEPTTAKFDGMPVSAIRTGLVDVIVPVEEISKKIVQYITHPLVNGSSSMLSENLDSTEKAVQEIYELLRLRCDIDVRQYKGSTITRRIQRRMGLHGLDNLLEYIELLQAHPTELHQLSKDMLIGVTRFFRDTEAFDEITTNIIPDIIERSSKAEDIRVWVAGCSTGQEAYTLAMLFSEEIQRQGAVRTVKIFATDVDNDAIAEASNGVFNINEIADVGEERFNRYFIKNENEQFTIVPSIRQMVVFAVHNLLKDPPFSNCQLAVCRNVLIYFQPKAQQQVLSMLHFSIQRDGYLFLGNSESLGGMVNSFEAVSERNRIYRKVSNINKSVLNSLSVDAAPLDKKTANIPSIDKLVKNYQQQKSPNFFPLLEVLMDDYVPACIIINEQLDVVHVYGDVAHYTQKIRAGKFSAKINDYICEDLNVAVSTAINRAISDKNNVQYSNVSFTPEGENEIAVKLRVIYLAASATIAEHLAIVFEGAKVLEKPLLDTVVKFDVGEETHQRIHDLEVALKKNQEYLQATVEELEATNEELQSANEELMAANEELQSTNEELQSVNEELYTVNGEYQEKIEEVTQINLDIDNIIKSADIGFILLDDALLIRRFSPIASKFINLREADLGRPFHHISHTLKYTDLLADIATVVATDCTIEKEIHTLTDGIVLIQIAPYFDEDNIALGCVITLTDISELRSLKNRLQESYLELRATIETAYWHQKKHLNILVVDDNEVDTLVIVSSLKSISPKNASYNIVEADTYDQAKALLAQTSFDVCMIDYNLGENTGFDLIESLRQSKDNPAFIILSGVLDDGLYQQAIDLGIYDVIDKKDISAPLLERSIRYTQRHKETEMYLANKSS